MQRVIKSVMKVGIWMMLIVCIISGFKALSLSSFTGSLSDKTGGNYITVAHAADDSDKDALIDFYKEKVDKLNHQCNILLILCILLLAALIISRLIQPQQSIYEVEKSVKKKKRGSKGKGVKEERRDIFDDAINSTDSEERYTVQKEVAEDLRDISDTLKL